jgi:hypothetical protein
MNVKFNKYYKKRQSGLLFSRHYEVQIENVTVTGSLNYGPHEKRERASESDKGCWGRRDVYIGMLLQQ